MGLFSKLTEKKECGICGKELGLLGKGKVEDGYVCKECASGLSPFFTERRHTTLDGIRDQLARREENRALVAAFSPTREYACGRWRVLVDDNRQAIVVTDEVDWRGANSDVIPFDCVTGADVRVDEERHELTYRDGEGNERHYEPPRYEESYDFWLMLQTSVSYIGNIQFRLNDWGIENRWSQDYDRCERTEAELRDALRGLSAAGSDADGSSHPCLSSPSAQPGAQDATRFCPSCGAPVTGGRFCESCGSPVAA